MASIESTLSERGSRYGIFAVHAEHTQTIKKLLIDLMGGKKWASLHDDQKEALEMIAHKLGRITNGDPNYDDSWRDIAGYAQLVANRLASQAEVKQDAAEGAAGLIGDLAANAYDALDAKQPAFKIGDRVRIPLNVSPREYNSEDGPGYAGAMQEHLGKTGQILCVSAGGAHATVKVLGLPGAYSWLTKDLASTPVETEVDPAVPGSDMSVHMIVLDSSDPDVEAIQRMLHGFLRDSSK